MEYIIVGLLIVVIILMIVILIKILKKKDNKDNLDMLERLSRFEVNVTKEIGDFKSDLSKEIISDLDPDAPTRGNPESLRTMLGSLFSSNVELD